MATLRMLASCARQCGSRPALRRCITHQQNIHRNLTRQRYYSSIIGADNIVRSPHPDLNIPTDISLGHYMLDAFGQHGDRTALVNGTTGESMTYAQLQTAITRVASGLTRMGLGKGDVLTIMTPNRPEYPIIYLATVSIGAVTSAINPLYTSGELHHALSHSKSKILVTIPQLLPVYEQIKGQCPDLKEVVVLGSAEGYRPYSNLAEDDGTAFPENIDVNPKEDMSSLPYSSGTTGLPKGVMLSHHNILSNIEQLNNWFVGQYNYDDVVIGALPFFHIYGLVIIMLYGLKGGAKIVTLPKFEPESFLASLQNNRATYLHAVPPMILFLGMHPIVDKYDLSSLHSLLCAAAPVGPEQVAVTLNRLNNPNLVFRQAYGMTESSPVTHCNNRDNVKLASIGQPVASTLSKVVDLNTGEALGANQEGEICSYGPQVMMGYLNNEKATKDTVDEQGWLHSGDLGYYDDDGFFFITDRLKELIKYKGLQVAPAELEALLLTHPDIQDVAVFGVPDERAGEAPHACIVARPGVDLSDQDVHQFVKGKVAEYKELSGGITFQTEIPKSQSGKILRRLAKEGVLAKLK